MIFLKRPHRHLVESYLDFINEMQSLKEKIDGDMLPLTNESLDAFVEKILKNETSPINGAVPESTYWACRDNMVVGRISLRHYLNDNLKEFGGHIGYDVRPSVRQQGIAKEMLKQVLTIARDKGIGKVLLTCAPSNVASNKAIISCGGKLFKTTYVEKWKRDTNYYWITVS